MEDSVSFSLRDSFLISNSLFLAELSLWPFSIQIIFTGVRERVYLEALPRLCCFRRLSRSVVMPV